MNLDKAIEILKIELVAYPHKGSEDWYDAVKLGIEAMKHTQRLRSDKHYSPTQRLPSETKE